MHMHRQHTHTHKINRHFERQTLRYPEGSLAGLLQVQFSSHSSSSHCESRVSGILGEPSPQEPNEWVAQPTSSSSPDPLPLADTG